MSEMAMSPGTRRAPSRLARWLVLSLLVHLPVVILLTVLAVAPGFPKPEDRAVNVTLTSETQTPPQPVPTERQRPDTATPEASPSPSGKGMIPATRFRAAEVLADPRSAGVRRDLGTLAPEIRLEQMCNLEAMEQVHLWKPALSPDFLVAYAMADTRIEGREIEAEGAAIRIAGRWFRLRYICTVTPDIAAIERFSFALGTEIPGAEWADHGLLPAQEDVHGD